MGTTRCTELDEDPRQLAYEHEWYVVALVGLLDVPAPVERPWWDRESDRLVTGWRPGCECGWRGRIFARDKTFSDHLTSEDGWPPPYVEGYTDAVAAAHVDEVLRIAYGERSRIDKAG
jgi:hypothetical protein